MDMSMNIQQKLASESKFAGIPDYLADAIMYSQFDAEYPDLEFILYWCIKNGRSSEHADFSVNLLAFKHQMEKRLYD